MIIKIFDLKVLMVLVVCLFILFSAYGVFAENYIDEARKSVVLVFAEDLNGNFLGWGSGFVIGLSEPIQYVATNWHVVNPEEYGRSKVNLFLWISADDYVPVTLYHSLPNTDLALLEIDPGHLLYGYDPIPLATRDQVSTGDDVYALGFPAGEIADFFTSYYTDVTVAKGIISKETTWNGRRVYQTDASINPGNSGGPLINDHGHVIAVNTFTMLNTDGINGSVQIDYLIEVLNRRGVPFKTADPVVDDEEDEEDIADTDNEDQMFLLIGIGAGLLVLALIIFSLTRGKKTTPAVVAPPRPPAYTNQAPPTQRAVQTSTQIDSTPAAAKDTRAKPSGVKVGIKGISGYFAGQFVDISGGQLIIGRDPRMAQLVYPQNRDKISRKHLTVRFDEKIQKFVLEDSSSNGTFLSSNEKLETGKPYYLNSGDRFYIAEPREVFEFIKE